MLGAKLEPGSGITLLGEVLFETRACRGRRFDASTGAEGECLP